MCAASNIRVIPENEKPPARRVDIYCANLSFFALTIGAPFAAAEDEEREPDEREADGVRWRKRFSVEEYADDERECRRGVLEEADDV